MMFRKLNIAHVYSCYRLFIASIFISGLSEPPPTCLTSACTSAFSVGDASHGKGSKVRVKIKNSLDLKIEEGSMGGTPSSQKVKKGNPLIFDTTADHGNSMGNLAPRVI